MPILICSQQGEVQVEEICHKLTQEGLEYVLFERYRKDHFITYHYHNKTYAILMIGNQEYFLNSATFPVVWYRPKPMIMSELPGEPGKIEEKFCINEWQGILKTLNIFLGESHWINLLGNSQRVSCKAYQLKLASVYGMTIPRTMITNNAKQIMKLFDGNHRVVYKTLNTFFTAKQAIYTNEITMADVAAHQQEIAMAPGIYQHYIEKKYELRVTVVGEQMSVVKIMSQQFEENRIDWRRNPYRDLYTLGELSEDTRYRLIALHKAFGLVYAAYDFIVDNNGQEIFLECNPSGQWLWLENALGLDVSTMIVNELRHK